MDKTNVGAAVEAGRDAALAADRVVYVGPEDTERLPVALIPNGYSVKLLSEVIKDSDRRRERPRQHAGKSVLLTAESFADHVNRYKLDESTIWADAEQQTIAAIYNDETRELPAWRDHRALYTCPIADEWNEWTARSDKPMSQTEFAQWVEDHLEDLASPEQGKSGIEPIELLELARSLQINTRGTFKRKINPTTGEAMLVCKQEHEESSTKIPRCFHLGIPVFEGGSHYRVEARIRFALKEGHAHFTYRLHRYREIQRAAFGDIVDAVREKTGLPVFVGISGAPAR